MCAQTAIVRRRAAMWRARRRRSCGRRPARTWRRAASCAATAARSGSTPSARPARYAAPSAVVSCSVGSPHGHAELVGLELQQDVHHRRAAVDAQLAERVAAGPHHRLDGVAGLVRHRLDDGPSEVGRRRAAGDADDRAAGVRDPTTGEPSPVKAGTTYTPPLSATLAASGPISAALGDDAEAVAQPLDGRAGDEDRALERVGDGAVGERPRHRRQHPLGRRRARRRRRSAARSCRCRTCSSPCPGSKHAWPNSAACWSPAMPLIGMPAGHAAARRRDADAAARRAPRRAARSIGTCSSSHSSSSHAQRS